MATILYNFPAEDTQWAKYAVPRTLAPIFSFNSSWKEPHLGSGSFHDNGPMKVWFEALRSRLYSLPLDADDVD